MVRFEKIFRWHFGALFLLLRERIQVKAATATKSNNQDGYVDFYPCTSSGKLTEWGVLDQSDNKTVDFSCFTVDCLDMTYLPVTFYLMMVLKLSASHSLLSLSQM